MKVLLGIGLGIFLVCGYGDVVSYLHDNYPTSKTVTKARYLIIDPNLGINDVISGRCEDEAFTNGAGTHISLRKYFNCSSFQIVLSDLIHGKKDE